MSMAPHPPNTEIPYEKRVAIVVLRLLYGHTFQSIADKFQLQKKAVHKLYRRAIERTEPHLRNSFMDVMQNVKGAPRSGRPPRIPPGSEASQLLRQLFLEYFELPLEVVTGHIAGIKMARSTAERVAHNHRDSQCDKNLVRVVQPIKPALSFDLKDLRVEFVQWAKKEQDKGAIFIYVDETYIHFGGHPRKKPKITKIKGEAPEKWARFDPPEQFQLMVWAAIGPYEDEIPFPYWIWEAETEQEKEKANEQLNKLNLDRKTAALTQQCNAGIPDTAEYNVLQEINVNIASHNQKLRAAGHQGNKGTKRARKPEQIFKYVELRRENQKGGIDWWLYRNEVLLKRLIPYYRAIQQRHSNRGKVWLIEDSVGLHGKAWESLGDIGVLRAPWIGNSPDLNQIEPLWGYLKDMLFDMRVFSASQAVKQQAKDRIHQEMASEGLKQCARHHINGYRAKLDLVVAHEGNNNFRG